MDGHDLKAGKARLGLRALRELSKEPRFQPATEDITVACAASGTKDRACRRLEAAGACKPSGTMVELCTMTPTQRDAVLR